MWVLFRAWNQIQSLVVLISSTAHFLKRYSFNFYAGFSLMSMCRNCVRGGSGGGWERVLHQRVVRLGTGCPGYKARPRAVRVQAVFGQCSLDIGVGFWVIHTKDTLWFYENMSIRVKPPLCLPCCSATCLWKNCENILEEYKKQQATYQLRVITSNWQVDL